MSNEPFLVLRRAGLEGGGRPEEEGVEESAIIEIGQILAIIYLLQVN